MTILEIIQLRAAREPLALLIDEIRESARTAGERVEFITMYRRVGLQTDLAVHIRRTEAAEGSRESATGLRLASALRVHGLVEHTAWKELA